VGDWFPPYGINGFSAATNAIAVHFRVMCSTPYGINGFGTYRRSVM
jgi:hypothetical protein